MATGSNLQVTMSTVRVPCSHHQEELHPHREEWSISKGVHKVATDNSSYKGAGGTTKTMRQRLVIGLDVPSKCAAGSPTDDIHVVYSACCFNKV